MKGVRRGMTRATRETGSPKGIPKSERLSRRNPHADGLLSGGWRRSLRSLGMTRATQETGSPQGIPKEERLARRNSGVPGKPELFLQTKNWTPERVNRRWLWRSLGMTRATRETGSPKGIPKAERLARRNSGILYGRSLLSPKGVSLEKIFAKQKEKGDLLTKTRKERPRDGIKETQKADLTLGWNSWTNHAAGPHSRSLVWSKKC